LKNRRRQVSGRAGNLPVALVMAQQTMKPSFAAAGGVVQQAVKRDHQKLSAHESPDLAIIFGY
jgi:hypothetical protein